jgi:hypothetical protein
MPVQTDLTSDRLGVIVTCSGLVTGKDLVEANAQVVACVNCQYQLWDFSAISQVQVSADAIHRLALQDSDIPEWSSLEKIAVVGADDSVDELTRVYELYSSALIGRRRAYEVRRFRTRKAAELWLETPLKN